jgi:proteasome lid subunit RPN8/RPN11
MSAYCISPSLEARLVAEAMASPREEICGLLFGTADRIDAARPTRNVASDRTTGFEIDPAALLAAHRAGRSGGRAPIGHYHSHPAGPARPSPRDLAAAAPGSLWLILGKGSKGEESGLEMRLWREDHGNFVEVNLIFAGLAPK